MFKRLAAVIAAILATTSFAQAAPVLGTSFGSNFMEKTVDAGGRLVHYRTAGSGPAVLLIHGYGDTGEMWRPLAQQLAHSYRVVVPDLPGLGASRPQNPKGPYDMAATARTLHRMMLSLGIKREAVIGHDIGLMAAYAYAAQFPTEVTKLALMDAPIPGVGPWKEVLLLPAIWHFHFNGKYAEQLTAGRERIYLNRIWDDFAFHPARVSDATRTYYAANYAQPGNMHAGFSYFAAFYTDADQNVVFAKTPLTMPVLALGGEKSFGRLMPQFASAVATNVQSVVIPDAGHWVMDENPRATMAALTAFLAASAPVPSP